MEKIGEFAREIIVERTQDKKLIVKSSKLQNNPSLAKSTIDRRARSKLSPKTTPTTSNLTETGQMLESLTVVATSKKVKITLSGNRNKEKARFVSINRPFLVLSNNEFDRVKRFILRFLKQ